MRMAPARLGWVLSGGCALSALAFVQCGGGDDVAPGQMSSADAGAPCTSDEDCAPPSECRATACIAGRCERRTDVEGRPISAQVAGDCQKVVCSADGTTRTTPDDSDVPSASECVARACNGGTVAETALAVGTACSDGTCDGAGKCATRVGAKCTMPSQCATGHCVDGVCCNEACTGECRACNVDGGAGVCTNVPYYKSDPGYVLSGQAASCSIPTVGGLCNGSGACKRVSTRPCQEDAQCMSNKCLNLKCLGAPGEACTLGAECVSGTCSAGACT